MNERARNKGRDFAKFLQSLPEHVRAEKNKEGRERAEAEHQRFQEHYRVGICCICGDDLASFSEDRPCVHWLMMPVGFTKQHFMDVMTRFSIFQLQAFLRWVANEEGVARNINDLRDEGTGKLIELTIRYKDCEWGFSCAEGDYLGHVSASTESQRPHYHFQMRYKRQAFVRYNDFHIPLCDSDIHTIETTRAAPDFVKQRFAGGEGMSDLFNDDTVDYLVKAGRSGGNEEEAPLKLDTILTADEGTSIRGDDLADLIEEARKTGVTITSLLPRLKNVNIQTIVTPGPGVVEQAPRSGRKSRSK